MKNQRANLIDCLAASLRSKKDLERRIAEMALGIVSALEQSQMTLEQAWLDLFNLDNFLAIRRRHLDRKLIDLFDWGMQLDNVAELAPARLSNSYQKITDLANRIIRKSAARPNSTAKQAARLRRSA